MRPIRRSKLRLLVGRVYFKWRRYVKWWFGGITFAKTLSEDDLNNLVFQHRTPTLRKLKDVDIQLQHNKEMNLKIAVQRLNGLVIAPGETMSYWKLIGDPTAAKGYQPGMVLFYGGFKPGVGGGLCQLSNLIYWMTLHTPLTVVERHRHSYDVFPDSNRTQPFGSGATCSYNYLDLMIRNDTDLSYQLKVEVVNHHLTGEWRSTAMPLYTYEVYEKEHRISQQYWGGYVRQNILHRLVFNRAKQLVGDEFITSNDALMMYSPLLPQTVNEVQY